RRSPAAPAQRRRDFAVGSHGMPFAAGTCVNERISRPHPVHRERVLESGAQALGTADLLALLIGTGAEGVSASAIAASLLEAAGSLAGPYLLRPHRPRTRRGVGPPNAERCAAA